MEGIKSFVKKYLKINLRTPSDKKIDKERKNINSNSNENNNNNEKTVNVNQTSEEKMTFKELCNFNGFICEEHQVTTKDNYLLTIYKIMPDENVLKEMYKNIEIKKKKNILKKKDPFSDIINTNEYICFFQHGLLDSSDGWVCNFKNKCLPFIMSNKGFEVWVANSRGNKYSKEHLTLDPLLDENKEKFFDFSFEEMGKYDLPACFDYILNLKSKKNIFLDDISIIVDDENNDDINENNENLKKENKNAKSSVENILKDYPKPKKRILYFGHSQGCASIVSAMTLNNDYFKENLKAVILLAPAVKVANMNSSIINYLEQIGLDDILVKKKIYEVLPYDERLQTTGIIMNSFWPNLSMTLLEEVSDENSLTNCSNRIKTFLAHYPSGASLKSILHFVQMKKSQKFQSFDYGKDENKLRYDGSEVPYLYDISKISGVPIIICAGKKDKLTSIIDVRWFKDQICGVNKVLDSANEKDNIDNIDNNLNIANKDNCLYSYYEYEHMGHLSFLISSDISWFNNVLIDIYNIIKTD